MQLFFKYSIQRSEFEFMVNRRLIRIKAFQVIFAQSVKEDLNFDFSIKTLDKSILKTQEMFFLLFRLIIDIRDLAEAKIENNKQKHLASASDLNPNTAFLQNKVLQQISENYQFGKAVEQHKLNWNKFEPLVEKLYKELLVHPLFSRYLALETSTYKDDKKMVNVLLEDIIGGSDELLSIIEDMSIFWTEDFELVINTMLKTVRILKEDSPKTLIISELYKNDDDKVFGRDLIKFVIQDRDKHLEIIEKYTKNWEVDRIMQVDIVLMEMALAEILNMNTIPLKVTLDEYIELSKFYSSVKSKTFINGILDKIIEELSLSGMIQKKGRGLIGQYTPNVTNAEQL